MVGRIGLFPGIVVAFALLAAACGGSDSKIGGVVSDALSSPSPAASRGDGASLPLSTPVPARSPSIARGRGENPRRFGSPPGYLFDAIPPLYDPEFATADEAPLDDDELVMGVEVEGEAKAYPITVLRSREMVNDELGGIPILATW
jgi:hypothetical protein